MLPALEQKLITRFPEFLGGLQNHGGYIYCENGWFVLLFQFFQEMETQGHVFEVGQIKEKFGWLRINPAMKHYPFNDDPQSKVLPEAVWDAIDDLGRKSYYVCEFCGKAGVIRWDRLWIRVLCDACEAIYDSPRRVDKPPVNPDKPHIDAGSRSLPYEVRKQLAPPVKAG